jgi:bifunctional UDP-N-acetylglucosamine pyrophosphorylase/glucosamine-1-phosphate N-acetyltransferase
MVTSSSPHLEVIVLAAGQGTRMNSQLPKVLHQLAGRPLLAHVLETVDELEPAGTHVVIGHGADLVREALGAPTPRWVLQEERLGTGHAVQQALPDIDDGAVVLVLCGDVPMVTAETLKRAVAGAGTGAMAVITAELADPAQLGRILRGADGAVQGIVEYKDASAAERAISEINSGIIAAPAGVLKELLAEVRPDNAQGEYYLTDTVALAVGRGMEVLGLKAERPDEVLGVNDRSQLAVLERRYQRALADGLMVAGATLADPSRLDVRGTVTVGADCFIDVNVVFEGTVVMGRDVSIGPGSVIRDSQLGDGVRVEAHTVVDGARVEAGCSLGPFARIRPGTELGQGVKIGNFVETKKAVLGAGTKASHLTYLGDATLGANCNVGAGTVTCNYDGIDKHRTTVGDGVFVGTNSTLVAPLSLGDDAFVAAGSTITADVDKGELAVGRGRQRNIQGWVRPDRRSSSDED